MSAERSEGRTHRRGLPTLALALFALALVARVGFLAYSGARLTPDSADYLRLAENAVAHGVFSLEPSAPFTPTIRRAPLYPVFLVPFLPLGESMATAVALTQAALDSATAVLVFLLACAVVPSRRWAAVAGLAYALHPGAVYQSSAVLSETLFTVLCAGAVLAVVRGAGRDRPALTAAGGLALGLATLCRPIAFPVILIFAGALVVAPLITRLALAHARRLLHAAALVACALAVVLPWTARSTRVSGGQFVLVQGFTPYLFYASTRYDWNQQDEATFWPRLATEDPYGSRVGAAKTPAEVVEADRLGARLAVERIKADPAAYASARARAVPYLFISSFDTFTGFNQSFRQLYARGDAARLAAKLSLLFLFSLAPLLLGTLGVPAARRDLAALLCASVWVYTLLVQLPMWVEYRYWLPAVPFLLVSAAAGGRLLLTLLSALRGRRRGAEPSGGPAAAATPQGAPAREAGRAAFAETDLERS